MKEILDIVDEKDEPVGTASRDECHKRKLRHRGVQVLIINTKGELFLQKRSASKDIFPGLYEGGITGHVRSGETYAHAAVRELKEELGVEAKERDLNEMFRFKILFENEHELVTSYLLEYSGPIKLDPEEAKSGEFISIDELKQRIKKSKKEFTPTFLIGLDKYMKMKENN